VRLASIRFIDFLDLKIKNQEPNQTRSVYVGLVRFWTKPNKVGYFFVLVQFQFSVLSEPLTSLSIIKCLNKLDTSLVRSIDACRTSFIRLLIFEEIAACMVEPDEEISLSHLWSCFCLADVFNSRCWCKLCCWILFNRVLLMFFQFYGFIVH